MINNMINNSLLDFYNMSFEKPNYNHFFSKDKQTQNIIFNDINNRKNILYKQEDYDISISIYINIKFSGYYILYWSANSNTNLIPKNNYELAHYLLPNYGITKIDKSGYIKVFLKTPNIYYYFSQGKKIFFPRMVNLIIYNNNKWISNEIYSQLIIPKINFKQFMIAYKKKDKIIINSNDNYFFSIKSIPNTSNISLNNLNLFKNFEIIKLVHKIIESQNKDLKSNIQEDNIYIIPIIIYNNFKNHTHEMLKVADRLLKIGFINLYYTNVTTDNYYKHTIKDYNKQKKKKIYFTSKK